MNYKRIARKYLDRSSDNNAHMITALALGLVAGAVISILFAPKKGVDTRNDLADRTKRFYGSIKDKFGVAYDQMNEDIKSSGKTVTQAKRKATVAKKKSPAAKKTPNA